MKQPICVRDFLISVTVSYRKWNLSFLVYIFSGLGILRIVNGARNAFVLDPVCYQVCFMLMNDGMYV